MTARKPLTARRLVGVCLGLMAFLAVSVVLGASVGTGDASLLRLLPGARALDDVGRTILFEVRLPRVLLAALLGGTLTVAGVVFQALLRNPLADPYVLGVSGGASIGGVVALVLGLGGGLLGGAAVPVMAFAGALAALLLIERIATVGGR